MLASSVGRHHVGVLGARLGFDHGDVVAVQVGLVGVVAGQVPVPGGDVVVQGEADVAHGAVRVQHRHHEDVDAVEHSAGLAGAEVLDEFQRALGGELLVPLLLRQEQDSGVARIRNVLRQVEVPALHQLSDHLLLHRVLLGVLLFELGRQFVVRVQDGGVDGLVPALARTISDAEGRLGDDGARAGAIKPQV